MKLTASERHTLTAELAKIHELNDSQTARLRGETEDELRVDARELADELRAAGATAQPTRYNFQNETDVEW
jgi:phosphoserine phosphatase